MAPVCPHGRAHWSHLANTIELVLPSAHPSPQPEWQIDPLPQNCPFSWGDRDPTYFMIPWTRQSPQSKLHHDRFSYFHTGDRRVSLHFTMATPSPKMAPSHGGSGLPCKTRFLMSYTIHRTHPSPQTKRHLYRFSRFCTDDRRVSLYFTMGRPFPPLKIAPSHGGSGSPSNTWFPGPTRVLNPNGISVGSALAGLISVTDRPTDHATRSVTIDRICVRSTAMRSKNAVKCDTKKFFIDSKDVSFKRGTEASAPIILLGSNAPNNWPTGDLFCVSQNQTEICCHHMS